jgi:nucleoside-diphosphate-sugar epimerase
VGLLDGKKVMITGGEGFIGSHLVEKLLGEGAEVRALVHFSPSG